MVCIASAPRTDPHTTELVIKRSRFLTRACHVQGLADGRAFVEEIRAKDPDASHHCWACVGADPGDAGQAAASDDGEPHGTAGRPMLQVLLHSGIGEVCLVVSRWFGGIKLGTGGLVRAYQDSVRTNLETLPVCQRRAFGRFSLLLPYACFDSFNRALAQVEGEVLATDYGEQIALSVMVPLEQSSGFAQTVRDITGGRSELLPVQAL